MEKPSENIDALGNLEPQSADANEVSETEGDAVRGGRKAGGGQQEYLKVTMEDVLISGY